VKSKIKYSDEPMGEPIIMKDFLATPEQLVPREENVKIAISLNEPSVEFFKEEGARTPHLVLEDDPTAHRLACPATSEERVTKTPRPAYRDCGELRREWQSSVFDKPLPRAPHSGIDLGLWQG
jgi:hypothetical protein